MTDPRPVELSILIVTYNCSADLARCLESIRKHVNGIAYEVLVRDNASGDALVVERLASEDVRVFLGGDNPGFGVANNEIAKLARGEFLLCLNPDTILVEDVPTALVEHLRKNSCCWACAPRIRNFDGSRQFSWNERMGLRWEFAETLYLQNIVRSRAEKRWLRKSPSGPWDVDFSSGACLCVVRRHWMDLGGFDPEFFLNHEDIELCLRIRRSGGKVQVLPGAWLIHADGGSQKLNWSRFVKDLLVAKRVYLRKRFSGWQLVAAKCLWRIRVLSRIGLCAVFARGPARTRLPGYIQAWRLGR